MNTYRSMSGNWSAESKFALDDEGRMVLQIHTSKRSGGQLMTYATVHIIENGYQTHRPFSDYSKCFAAETTRCDKRKVEEQHQKVLLNIDTIRADAMRHYQGEPALVA